MSGIYRGPNASAVADALNIDGDKGDLTISNSGLEWTINPDAVDFSKIQNITTDTVLGRATVGSGNVEEITCTAAGRALLDDANAASQRTTLGLGNAATATIGTEVLAYDANLQSFVNTFTLPTTDATNGFVLSTNGSGTLQLTAPGGISDADYGDITVSTGGTVWTIDNDVVTYAKIQNVSTTDKLLGRSTLGAGDVEEITCTAAGRALLDDADATAQRTTLGLGSLATLSTVTNAELDSQYLNALPTVVAASGDFVGIADTSDSGNKKKTLVSDIVALATTTFASEVEYETGSDTTKALNSAVARAKNLVLKTAIATTSGTSHDFTGIPSWVKRITFEISSVSTNGASNLLFQIGDSGGIESSGYFAQSAAIQGGAVGSLDFSSGFGLADSNAAGYSHGGSFTLTLVSGTTWVFSGSARQTTSRIIFVAGEKTLSGTLDRVRLTTLNGTDVFDAGSFNIIYE